MQTINLNSLLEGKPRQDIRSELSAFYDDCYRLGVYNPNNSIGQWKNLVDLDGAYRFRKGLDIGCGAGRGIKYAVDKGFDVYGCDVASHASVFWKELGIADRCTVAPMHDLPYRDGEFDLVLCMDVLEHIPEFDIEKSVSELERVGSYIYMVAISLVEEHQPVGGRITTHITLKPAEWWREVFQSVGIRISLNDVEKEHWWFYGFKQGAEGEMTTPEGKA